MPTGYAHQAIGWLVSATLMYCADQIHIPDMGGNGTKTPHAAPAALSVENMLNHCAHAVEECRKFTDMATYRALSFEEIREEIKRKCAEAT